MSIFGDCDVCEKPDRTLTRCIVSGIETLACDECRGVENVEPMDTFEPIADAANRVLKGVAR
jgi:hypothetical protein